MSFSTIATFENPIDAHLLRVELENAGFTVYIADENLIGVQPLFSNAIGGVKVQVPTEQKDDAILLINNLAEENKKDARCPQCESTKIQFNFKSSRSGKSLLSHFIALLTFTHPLYVSRVNRCLDCNFEFTDEKA